MDIECFEGKKIVIFVPHEDDEIHLAGNIIGSLTDTQRIYVIFTTNGDFIYNAKYRYKEAIKSLYCLGKIEQKNIIFLGYPDQPYDQNTHMYNSSKDWKSNKGIGETYAPCGYVEWNYRKFNEHARCNRDNLKNNIKEIINEIKPDILICNDLDFHSDHLMTSLLFDKAIGEILIENKEYSPLILKGFTYENSYWGPDDFYNKDYEEMKFDYDENGNLKSNPYYNKTNYINIDISDECRTKNLLKNKIFKAILKHKSQNLVSHASKMINFNQVYWERSSLNLLRDAKIEVTSGVAEYLNDFVLCDTKDVLNGNIFPIKYDKKIWIPSNNDLKKEIYIEFKMEKYVDTIKLYNGLINDDYISNIDIIIDGKMINISLSKKYVNEIYVGIKCKKIIIHINDKICNNGFSEIEILPHNPKYDSIITKKATSSRLVNVSNKLIISILVLIQKIYRKLFIR